MRLTLTDRSGVVKRALAARFDGPNAALKLEREALARRLYDVAFPEKVRKWAAADPNGKWLHKDTCLRFNLAGHQIRLDVSDGLPVPYDAGYCRSLITIADETLRDEHQKLADRQKELDEQRSNAETQLSGLLSRVTTLNKLREIWPEGESFYAHLAPRERIDVPAVQVADINKLLGIAA